MKKSEGLNSDTNILKFGPVFAQCENFHPAYVYKSWDINQVTQINWKSSATILLKTFVVWKITMEYPQNCTNLLYKE